jgi:riboflavin kinase/FMN adenylyltransferase
MEIHSVINGLQSSARGAVVAIGNFDGVHRGHQAVIAQARAQADALGAPLGVMTFEPHPRAFFAPDAPPFRLTPLAAKARALAPLGVDHLYAVAFDRTFAAISAHDFVTKVLAENLGAVSVVVGGDFKFGRGREGDILFLQREAPAFGIQLSRVVPVTAASGPIASRRIRELLTLGDLDAAADLLGRPWEMEGPVVHGDKLGRTIGYPTANIDLGDMLRPKIGIYAVEVLIEGETDWRDGVASLGYRPAVGGRDLRFEVNLFDFAGDIYGRTLRVRPVKYLRDEIALDGLNALKKKIAEDVVEARAILKSHAKVDGGGRINNKSSERAAPRLGGR